MIKTYILAGIVREADSGGTRTFLITRRIDGHRYQRQEYPAGSELTVDAITNWLALQLNIEPENLDWPDHIDIPKG